MIMPVQYGQKKEIHVCTDREIIRLKSQERVQKQKVFYRGYFTAHSMRFALKAMEIALSVHCGVRSNGCVEVSHQFDIVGSIISAFDGKVSSEVMDLLVSTAFLHDVLEDYPEYWEDNHVGGVMSAQIINAVMLVSKPSTFKKTHDDRVRYFTAISTDFCATIVKLFDRLHNLQTMGAGFSPKKQELYIEETVEYFYPLLKFARTEYSEYYLVFVSVRRQIESIIETVSYLLGVASPVHQ